MSVLAVIIIFVIIYCYAFKNATLSIKSLFTTYLKYLNNVNLFYSDGELLLYRADKGGENFIFALKNSSYPFSLKDIATLYEKAEKLHIHNRILITDYRVDNSSAIYKSVKEYGITIWNSTKIEQLIKNEFNDSTEYSSNRTSSALTTSDTSDDNCEIDEANDPIKDGTFNTHGIFSFLGNKPDHL